ncbi:iron ascorbate-dependent oxidoreductase [Ancistrocladus abbreviatus]
MPAVLSDAIVHLDYSTLKELPESHAWVPLNDEYPSGDVTPVAEAVPVINLDDPIAEKLIGHACKTWGVFQVINHGVPTRLLDSIQSAGNSLFSLALQRKLRAARLPDGVAGYGPARISSFFPKRMWSEGFTIVGSPLEHARQLWPNDYLKFCDITEEYERVMKQLAGKVMCLMLGSLGITNEDVKWAGPKGQFEGACAALQMNYYAKCPDPKRAMGLAAHTDSTLVTILYQNNTTGLQVLREGVGWVTVPPLQGGLTINVGDLFHILTNGLYPSVLHRAVVNGTHHRLSVAYLYGPPVKVLISPLQKIVNMGYPPLYRSVSWKEYLEIKGQYFDKALSLIRLRVPINGIIDVNEHNFHNENCVRVDA